MPRTRCNVVVDSNSYLGPDTPWKLLGISIVKQAVIDWRESTLRLAKPLKSNSARDYRRIKLSAEHFLSSHLCEFYSGLDGPTLLRKLKKGDI